MVGAGFSHNAYAVGALEPGEVLAPALYRTVVWANATADFPMGSDRYWGGNLSYLFDGLSNQIINDTSTPRVYFLVDLGTPHTLTRFGVGGRNDSKWGWNRIQNMKIAGSQDGETWTDLFQLTKTDAQEVADVFTWSSVNYYPSSDTTTKYRYVKFYNFADQSGHISETCVYSPDVMVEAGAANPFETNAAGAGDHPDGVLLSAKLVNAPDATYDLVAYVSAEDHGDDRAAWLAADDVRSVTLGEDVTSGTVVSARVAGLGTGRWHWRAFAVNGSTVVASDPTHPFAVGTTAHLARAYVKNSGLKGVYDGATGSNIGETSSEPWIVFDMSDLPAGKHVDSVRLWVVDSSKTGYAMRYTQAMSCDFGSSTEALDWGGTTISAAGNDRVVDQVSAEPAGIVWTTGTEYLYNKSPYGTQCIQWLFDSDTVSSRPRYLRFKSSTARYAEIEVRLTDDPGGLVAFSNDSEPRRIGTPSSPYGSGEIAPGVENRVTIASRDVYGETSTDLFNRLLGWTLTVTNAANEKVVTTSTAETVDVCSYTPAPGDKSASLVWHWKTWAHLPAKVAKVVIDNGGAVIEKNGAVWVLEDRNFGTYPGNDSDSTDILWDLGSPRAVKWFRFAPRNYAGRPERYNDFILYGSNDKSNWTVLYRQNKVTPAINTWYEYTFDTPQTFRYFRVGNILCTEMSELWLYSDELMLNAARVVPWESDSVVDSVFDDKGITLNGRLVWSPSGSAEVTAYAAMNDYEDDLAAWQAHGRAVTVGTVSVGASYTAHFADLPHGIWHCRAFATAGGVTVASSPAVPCQTGTRPFHPQAYVGAGVGSVCDGNTGPGPDTGGWLVFDLSKIPAGHRLAAVRIWPRNNWDGSWNRVVGSSIKFGYADGTETWNVTKVVRDGTSAYPTSEASSSDPAGVTWGPMSEVFALPVSHWMWYGDNVFEMPVTANTDKIKPRYLYFRCESMNVREVSLRIVPSHGTMILFL